jgi:predicted DNA-binding transcriptional regulator YafY
MPANKYALLRYRIIDKCLRNSQRPYPSKELLRSACDEVLYQSFGERVSPSTIEKDLYAMRFEEHLGYEAPIAFHKLRKGYYYTDPNYSLEKIPLSHEEIDAVKFAAITLGQYKELELFKQFGDAIEKILQRLDIGASVSSEEVGTIVEFEKLPHLRGTNYIAPIFRAIQGKKSLEIRYLSRNALQTTERRLWPLLLKEYQSLWYIIAYEYESQKVKTYALDRIYDIQFTEGIVPEGLHFDKDKFFNYSIGITATAAAPEKVHLRFFASARDYVLLKPLHRSQRVLKDEDEFVDIELTVQPSRELISTILWFGSAVSVLSPLELKEDIREELGEMLKNLERG